MQLQEIDRSKLSVSALNMRAGKRPPDIADILPTVRARGILVPLIVRPAGDDAFEIIAGRRRFFAAEALAAETGIDAPLPCAVIEAGDDAAAIEASLIENVARADAHEVEQWETFTRLVREGRSPADLAVTFGLSDRQVRQVLALGNLLPRIRDLYRKEEIDPGSVRLLTMATRAQQRDWLALLADPDTFTPTGHNLKAWLFGGAPIATKVALFDLAAYEGEIVADLFGEGGYFASAEQFWQAQNAAVEARRQAYLAGGWSEVVVLAPGEYFQSWEYEKRPKAKGGKVMIDVSPRGEVAFHEGLIARKEAKRQRAAEQGDGEGAAPKPVRAEVTSSLQSYIDLHRHAAVRAALLDYPSVALRLLVAHAIAGSYLFSVKPEPQRGATNAVTESVETSPAETLFDARRRRVMALVGFDADAPTLVGGAPFGSGYGTADVFARLLERTDDELLEIAAIAIGEALEAGSAAVEQVGQYLGVDMARFWQPDEAFYDLNRDKEVLAGMIAELAGEAVGSANKAEKAKAQKAVIRDCLAGDNGRAKVEGWVPRWMRFPPSAYTERGGVGSVRRDREIAELAARRVDAEAAAQAAAGAAGGEGAAVPANDNADPLAGAVEALVEAAAALGASEEREAEGERPQPEAGNDEAVAGEADGDAASVIAATEAGPTVAVVEEEASASTEPDPASEVPQAA